MLDSKEGIAEKGGSAWTVCRFKGGGLTKKKRGGDWFWGGLGVGDNPMYTMNLAITFNCDFKLLMSMPSLLISNKKVLSCNWLATNNNFWCCQEINM